MKIYLVGGAVRDRLLGYPSQEKDWVVVGATAEELLGNGFRPVGKDFPVFLHPKNNEEYALARTERKTAPGYHGFEFQASPSVTLEEDLARRDLTINAMAEDENGRLIDPYKGRRDLEKRLLRHVSHAFTEDPVRILRVARFLARYAHLGFTVANETKVLMREMVEAGEVDALVAERVWVEFDKALGEQSPRLFIELLREVGALKKLMPEIDRLFGVPQPEIHHPEIDTGVHTLLVLDEAVKSSQSRSVRFAALLHDLGKGVTPKEQWPRHIGHETAGLPLLDDFCDRLRVPNSYRKLAAAVMRHHLNCHRALELKSKTILKLFRNIRVMHSAQEALLVDFLTACRADARGRGGKQDCNYPQLDFLLECWKAAVSVKTDQIDLAGLEGKEIGLAIQARQTKAIDAIKLKRVGKPAFESHS